MRRIELAGISLCRFRSYREEQLVEFIPEPGLYYLAGRNQVEPGLGSNGAGKTSIWLALYWCLYGSVFKIREGGRALRASALVTRGEKQPHVAVTLLIDGAYHSIARTGNPDRLTLDGKPATQQQIDQLLGLPRELFPQCVLYGQGAQLFADLSVPERGVVFDNILNSLIWLAASREAALEQKENEKEVTAVAQARAHVAGQLQGMPSLADLRAEAKAWQDRQDALVEQLIAEVERQEDAEAGLRAKLRQEEDNLRSVSSPTALRKSLDALRQRKATLDAEYNVLMDRAQQARTRAGRLDGHSVCTECGQPIPKELQAQHRRKHLQEAAQLEQRLQLNGPQARMLLTDINAAEAAYTKAERIWVFRREQKAMAEQAVYSHGSLLASVLQQAERALETENPVTPRIAHQKKEAKRLQAELEQLSDKYDAAEEAATRSAFWAREFKNVRLFVVNEVLALLEVAVNSAAAGLGLFDWVIKFTTERETQSETVERGLYIQITSPAGDGPWEAWSGGEQQRLRLAISLGLSALIQRMAGVDYGFEIWDEPNNGLSDQGITQLLDVLRTRAEQEGRCVWVCDHRGLIYNGFTGAWTVTKTDKGSRIDNGILT